MTDFLYDGDAASPLTIALAHGAGAPMDSPFLNAFASGLAGAGLRVVRFEFPYMAERRTSGKKRPPSPAADLQQYWRDVISELGAGRLIIGGKSLGGRMASMVADAGGVRGLVCLGYPFHPAGKPGNLRTRHLETLRTRCLICQGTRDRLGNRDDVAGYTLSEAIEMHWLADGDHDFAPRKASGLTTTENWRDATGAIAAFAASL